MPQADYEGPLQEFKERTKQIREVVAAVEAVSKTPTAVSTTRPSVDLNNIGAQTNNTANSMALIFLASTFEEFVRELTIQGANALIDKYHSFPEADRHRVRDAYWRTSRDQLRYANILTGKNLDATLIAKLRSALDAQQGFVIGNDPTKLSVHVFPHHSNNFKPAIVTDIMKRIGISSIVDKLAENTKLKSYFGVTTKKDCLSRTSNKWTEFYDRRNETVHSLGGTSGYAIEVIFDYIHFLELVAEAMKGTVERTTSAW